MNNELRAGVVGAIAGALAAVVIGIGALTTGLLRPASDARIHDYLLANPQILVELTNRLQEQQALQAEKDESARQKAVNKIGLKAYFNPRIAFVTGPANAKTTFVEFFDYNCPYCRASLPTVKAFYAAHKNNGRFAFIEFPIKGPQSVVAARAALAARKQPDKYLAFHFLLMNEEKVVNDALVYADAEKAGLDVNKLQADMHDPSLNATIAAAHALAAATRIDGTPAFIVNGTIHEGALDESDLPKLEQRT